jgi:zinc protease
MLDRTVAPPFTRSTHFELIHPDTISLSNGLKIFSINGGNQRVIKIELLIKAGRWEENIWGAAYFSANLLSKGTLSKSSFEIARLFDHYGAHLEVSPGLDIVSISLYTLTKNLSPTLTLLHEILQEANFPEKELTQMKAIYLQNLKVNNEKTSFLASKLIRKNLFGEQHPYGKELEESDVDLLTRNALVAHVDNLYHDLTILVSGDVKQPSLNLIADIFSNFNYRPQPVRLHAFSEKKVSRQLQDKEGSLQSSLRSAKIMIERTHPDYPAVLFLNHILGGYFGSRLMKNIREEKGLTYGIYSSFNTLQHHRYLVIGADVNKENLSLTFDEIHKELRRLREERLPAEELETARNHFIGSLQSEMTTPFAHAEKIKSSLLFNLPDDFYPQLILRVDALTTEDLIETAAKYFQENSFLEVAVG